MANEVDQRVVQMKFDNAAFERGVSTTMSTLDKLKDKLNFGNAARGLEGLNNVGKNFNLDSMSTAVDGMSKKFSAMSVAGVTAVATIANKAVNAGITLVKSFTISPVLDGFHQYEQQIKATQTILGNVRAEGAGLQDVTKVLNTLNDYANKTVFNFSDMATALGSFTSAGIKLNTASSAIQGLSNVAAAAGANATQVAQVLPQISQALSRGKVTAQDWMSVTSAGMASSGFKNAILETAKAMGSLKIPKTESIEKWTKSGGSFQQAMEKGAITSDVLKNALSALSGTLSDAQLKQIGYSSTVLKAIKVQASQAAAAATTVKTFSELKDNVQQGVGSAYAQVFKTLFGDLEGAKVLFTGLSNIANTVFVEPVNSLNKFLIKLKGLYVLTNIATGFKIIFKDVATIFKSLKDAFREIFPPATGKALLGISQAWVRFTMSMQLGSKTADNLKRTFAGVFAIIRVALTILAQAAKGFLSIFGIITAGSGGGAASILQITAKVGDFLVAIEKWLTKTKAIEKFFAVLTSPIKLLKPAIGLLVKLASAFASLITGDTSGFQTKIEGIANGLKDLFGGIIGRYRDFAQVLSNGFAGIQAFFSGVANETQNSGSLFEKLADDISNVAGIISQFTGKVAGFLSGLISHIHGLNSAGLGQAIIQGLSGGISSYGKTLVDSITKVAQYLLDAFKNFFGIHSPSTVFADLGRNLIEGLKVGILGAFSLLKTVVSAIGQGLKDLFGAVFTGLVDAIKNMDTNDAVAVFNAVLLGSFYLVFRRLIKNLSGVFGATTKMIGNISGVFSQLSSNLKSMQNNVRADTLIKIAVALGLLTASVVVLTHVDPGKLKTALVAMGAMFAQLAATMITVNKFSGKAGTGKVVAIGFAMVGLATAVLILSAAVKVFASMDPAQLAQGMGAVLVLLGALVGAAIGMEGTLKGAAAMFVMASALGVLLPVIALLGLIPYENLAKGLGTIAVALLLLVVAANAMETALPGAAAMIAVAGAIAILTPSILAFGQLKWGTIAKAMVALALALTILVVAANAMDTALPGAAALLIVAAAVEVLVPAIALLGQLKWSTILKGIGALALILAVLVTAMYALTPVIVVMALFSKSIAVLGAGLFLTGLGMAAFAAGLATLAVSGTAGFAVLTAGIVSFLAILPLIARQAGYAFAIFIEVIGENSVKIVGALTKIVLAILRSLQTLIPEGIRTIGIFLSALVQEIARRAPEFFAAGVTMIKKFLQTIRDNIGDITRIVADIIINFIQALTDKLPDIVEAGVTFIITFINSLADAIQKHSGDIGEAGANLGIALAEGMIKGIAGAGKKVASSAWDLGKHALGGIAGSIVSHSPSKESEKLGKYFGEGFVQGMDKHGNLVSNSATGLGDTAVESMKKSLSALSNLTDANVDVNPTIKPVLDLSGVKADSTHMQKLLDVKPVDVKANISAANNASVGLTSNHALATVSALNLKKAADAIAANAAKQTAPSGPRPISFHIDTVQDGDSLMRRARATNRMLSLAEGGDSPQLERIQ